MSVTTTFAPSAASDHALASWFARVQRLAASPAEARLIFESNGEQELRDSLPALTAEPLAAPKREGSSTLPPGKGSVQSKPITQVAAGLPSGKSSGRRRSSRSSLTGPQVIPTVGSPNPIRWLCPGMGTMGCTAAHEAGGMQPEMLVVLVLSVEALPACDPPSLTIV